MANKLYEVLEFRILLLDGGFGTMVQQYGFTEEDYRGERFRDWNVLLKGCNDLLAVTRPGAVREIHVKYLQAGADIIETDSFNANAVSLADYGLEAYAYEISRAAAGVARSAADEFTARNPLETPFRGGLDGPDQPHGLDVGRRRKPRSPRGDLRAARPKPTPNRRAASWTAARMSCWSKPFSTRSTPRPPSTPSTRWPPKLGPRDPRHDLGHAGRRQRPHPLGTDRRGFLRLGIACAALSPSASTAPMAPDN